MPYFFSQENLAVGQKVTITDDEARHLLLSHRVKKGEKIKFQDPNGQRFLTQVLTLAKKQLEIEVLEKILVPQEPMVEVALFQSVVSEKALDFIFQKGTELGLSKIILFNSANTAVKLSLENFEKKRDRWNKIIIEAAKQCERAKWPTLYFLNDISQVAKKAVELDKVFLTDISGGDLKLNLGATKVGLIVGPEGGFNNQEILDFKSISNLQSITLGPVLLRAETAALAALSQIRPLIY